MTQKHHVVAAIPARTALTIGARDLVTALIADPTQEWGKPFAPFEPVFKVDHDDGRTEYHSASKHYLRGAG